MQRFEMATDPRDPPGLRWLETLITGVYFLSGFGSLITFTSTVGIVSCFSPIFPSYSAVSKTRQGRVVVSIRSNRKLTLMCVARSSGHLIATTPKSKSFSL
jgi:hypothetical protein